MAGNPDLPEKVFSEQLALPDGRRVRVLAYDDGSVRFCLKGLPYVLTEAYLSGGGDDEAIVRLSPGRQGSAADRNWMARKLDGRGGASA
ncbi:hypothetical protein LO771_00675 [Streptacidiphilus sp. ASG 303]|uniref:hypothetical protein n=1 Tax=Streptacidiphilus sp. ASG 303 TaxID=2896847 RepID=UPI001E582418|nr:hypothetical protein [Streptacidiphilus sp. ASG 303]MCD0480965.1 hypothetical protein [Streptacidiphilus sp. ASG 303]